MDEAGVDWTGLDVVVNGLAPDVPDLASFVLLARGSVAGGIGDLCTTQQTHNNTLMFLQYPDTLHMRGISTHRKWLVRVLCCECVAHHGVVDGVPGVCDPGHYFTDLPDVWSLAGICLQHVPYGSKHKLLTSMN